MTLLSWLIVAIPVALVLWIAVYSARYVRGVADYLAAGRVAGRYVISVGDMTSGAAVVYLIGQIEMQYDAGVAVSFWTSITTLVTCVMALTGYVVYRWRETRALSMGQFFEIRYSRRFRIVAAFVRTVAEMLTNAVGPAVAAQVFIYFLGFPTTVDLGFVALPTYSCVVAVVLLVCLVVIWPGGRISLLITDAIQGIMCYPIFMVVSVFVLYKFSFWEQIGPTLADRVPTQSFLNPFDVSGLRNFGVFMVISGLIGQTVNRGAWIGNDTTASGRTPHEQKMGNILGAWRNGFSSTMAVLLSVMVITLMNHNAFRGEAFGVRVASLERAVDEATKDLKTGRDETRGRIMAAVSAIGPADHQIGVDPPLSQKKNLDTPYLEAVHEVAVAERGEIEGEAVFAKTRTIYHQMLAPMVFRDIFPPWLVGLFCLLMVLYTITTDDSRIFNSSSTFIQDVVMPLRGRPFGREEHLRWLRGSTVGVGIFFFAASLFLINLNYINMLLAILISIWTGGAGVILLGGLYTRFGTTAGAWTALAIGSGVPLAGIGCQAAWVKHLYPAIAERGWVEGFDRVLRALSGPLEPWIEWRMKPDAFPINSYEIATSAIMLAILGYVVVSLLTCRGRRFNLEKMLHRGVYALAGDGRPAAAGEAGAVPPAPPEKETPPSWRRKAWMRAWGLARRIYNLFLGFTPECTRGDKIIIWSVFFLQIVWHFLICFVLVLVWNRFWPIENDFWVTWFFVQTIVVGVVIGAISTVWFLIGGIRDIRRLFRDLARRVDDPADDGWVEKDGED